MLILALVLLAGGGAVYWLGGSASNEEKAPSFAVVTRGPIEETVMALGALEPKDYVDVGAQVSGQIKKLYVDIGDSVKAGDLLAEIDPKVYQSLLEADQAKLASLEAQMIQQKAQVDFDRLQFERAGKLVGSKSISQEEMEDKDRTLKIAEAAVLSLDAQIREINAALEKDTINLGYTKIYAPMDGIVSDRTAREGQTLNANQTTPTVLQIANLDVMTIRAEIAEADVSRLKPEMAVSFTTLGSRDRAWHGVIRQILPTPEIINDVVLYNALVDVENKDRSLMKGMSVQASFAIASVDNVLRLLPAALGLRLPKQDSEKGKAYQVSVDTPSGAADRVVFVGLRTRAFAEIREGLAEGEKVLLAAPEGANGSKKDAPRLPPSMGARL